MTSLFTPALILAAVILILAAWRLLAYLISLPCPPFFIFILESRMMDSVAGPAALISRAKIEPGMTVLDAGCGPGRMAIPLAKYLGPEGKVIALDLQEEMLNQLGRRVKAEGLTNIQTIQGGLGGGSLKGVSCDRALLVTVLGEIPEQDKALQEIHHALAPGGLLSITEVLPDPHFQRRKKVIRLGSEAGFQVELAGSSWRSYTLNLTKEQESQV